VEQKVVDEILRIIELPENVSTVNRIANEHSEISRQNLVLALENLTEAWSFLYPTKQHKIVGMLVDEGIIGDDGLRLKIDFEEFDRVFVELTLA
jgi:hypothetical protein